MKKMIVIGLTGGIGMGKSTAAGIFRDMGLPVYNADHAVHELLRKGGKAVRPVAGLFPEALRRGAIDRRSLGHHVFGRPAKLKKLEKIMHPLVRRAEIEFLRKARKRGVRAAVLEIPLLFETGGHERCDFTICVTAPKRVQMARVMRRPGMTKEKLRAIMKRQMPAMRKHRMADFVIGTGKSRALTRKHLQKALQKMHKG